MAYNATITKIEHDTEDALLVTLRPDVKNSDLFSYKQGQNLTLIQSIDGEELRRPYSICASVADATLRVGIKRIPGGRFSTWAHANLQVGDVIKVLPPTGVFNSTIEPTAAKRYVAIAAGSGITPIYSILKTILEAEPHSVVTLLYGNKRTANIMLLEDLEDLKNRHPERFNLLHSLSEEHQDIDLLDGRIDENKLHILLNHLVPADTIDAVFLCGPYQLIETCERVFLDVGLQKNCIHKELFGTPDDLAAISADQPSRQLTDEQARQSTELTFIVDGKQAVVTLTRGGESILDAALTVQTSLPFACKGGVCATCKARLVAGEVEMDRNFALSESELEKGFVLTCQSPPTTQKVTIDFDQT